MDTGADYIKMCRESKEIQNLWKWKTNAVGDFCWLGEEYLDCAVGVVTKPFIQLDRRIWLPQQDQLQGMVEGVVWFESLYRLWEWVSKPGNPYVWMDGINKFESMEQLWLAFVMSERYSKHWSGNEWLTKQ